MIEIIDDEVVENLIENHLFRCSSLGKIMGAGKSIGLTETQKADLQKLIEKPKRTAKQEVEMFRLIEKRDCKHDFSLSQTAKTYVQDLVKQELYQYEKSFGSKETSKGDICEDESIQLYGDYCFQTFKKNKVSKPNKWIKGTCDIDFEEDDTIIDTKTSWSKETFPELPEHGENSDYEWQLRGYMMLWNRSFAQLVYCLVNTPFSLLNLMYDRTDIHEVEHLPIERRITVLNFTRCFDKEAEIIEKVKECRRYGVWYRNKIINQN